jgi:predicted small lipoprotein YifL
MVTACGKKGPLLYPDLLVSAAPTAVIAQQSGSSLKLQFALPDKNRAGRPLQGVAGVKINKRTIETAQKDVCRSCMADYRLFRTLYLDLIPSEIQRVGNSLVLLDREVNVGNSYSYTIATFTADGVDGASYVTAFVPVTLPLPAPVLNIESFPTEVKLQISFTPLISGRLLGYNLYRSLVKSIQSFLPINSEPLKGNEYVDSGLERGVKYRYSARAIIMLESGDISESVESQEVEGMLKNEE